MTKWGRRGTPKECNMPHFPRDATTTGGWPSFLLLPADLNISEKACHGAPWTHCICPVLLVSIISGSINKQKLPKTANTFQMGESNTILVNDSRVSSTQTWFTRCDQEVLRTIKNPKHYLNLIWSSNVQSYLLPATRPHSFQHSCYF